MDPLETVDFGYKIDSAVAEAKLLEMCPDLTFDYATKHDLAHPRQSSIMGIHYQGRYICSMDRGIIPEVAVWANFKRVVEIPWYAADREDASIRYEEILPSAEGYRDLYEAAKRNNDPSLMIKDDGKLLKLRAFGYEPVGRRFLRVGWRHTFAKLLGAQLPGITHDALVTAFGINPDHLGVLAHADTSIEDESCLPQ